MQHSMYQASVPAFQQTLTALTGILSKAEAHLRERGGDPAEYLEARLAPDMFPFLRQVQVATDHAKGATARLAGRDVPKYDDTERSFAELNERIARTMTFISSVEPAEIDGSEERQISLMIRGEPRSYAGQHYLRHFALPNFYFHATTAYGILRHKGVPLGKADFIGAV